MASEKNVLLVDVGNTLIKACRMNETDKEPAVHTTHRAFVASLEALKVTHVYLGSVRDDAVANYIGAHCEQAGLSFKEIVTEKKAFGISNAYANVDTMGVDRWLGIMAAQGMTKKDSFCVMDVGTAITVDFVSKGQHLGGWIAPGFHSMRAGLIESTKKVFGDDTVPDTLVAGNTTQSGVAQGCLAATQGIYRSAIAYLNSKQTAFDVIIGGGDKKLFAFPESSGSIPVANLVVQGLARYAKRDLFA